MAIKDFPTDMTAVTIDPNADLIPFSDTSDSDNIKKTTFSDALDTKIDDSTALATKLWSSDKINTELGGKVNDTGNETIAGVKTFSSDPLIPDEVYGAGWNGSLEPPTKNALYDKIETISAGSGISEVLAIAYAVAL